MATYTDPTTIVSTAKGEPVQPGSLVLLIGGVLTLVVALLFFADMALTNGRASSTEKDIASAQQQLNSLQSTADQLSTLSNQSKDLHSIFDTQKRWESVLDTFAQRLHKQMAVTSLQMSDKGTVTLGGIVPNYTVYAKMYQAFTDADGQKYFSVVKPTLVSKVNDAKGNLQYVTFTFDMALQPMVLNAGSTKATTPQ